MFHFLFPCNPLNAKKPEELFAPQFGALANAGFTISLLPDEAITSGIRLRHIPPQSLVVYRGWMLTGNEYRGLTSAIETSQAKPFITLEEYLAAHHLPNWYPLVSEHTPETRIYPADADLISELQKLGWKSFFIKDYVKSLKTSIGSMIHDPAQIPNVVAEMINFRGEIEGGICVRRVEAFKTATERRYFVVNGMPYSASGESVPELVAVCAKRIPSKFFSVDIVERNDGELRVVEIGDGQVSDLVGWTPEAFTEMWLDTARN